MPGFQRVPRATQARGPRYVDAVIAQHKFEQADRARKFRELMGLTKLYNATMGDRTPIADFLFGKDQQTENTANELRNAAVDSSGFFDTAQDNTGAGSYETAGYSDMGGSSSGSSTPKGGADPWSWLAAAIVANEEDAFAGGYRSEDPKEYVHDLASGETMRTDFVERYPEALGTEYSDNEYGQGLRQYTEGAAQSGRLFDSPEKNVKREGKAAADMLSGIGMVSGKAGDDLTKLLRFWG